MNALFRWVSLRHLLHEWPRTLLTVMGVALGVAVFVSIRLANHSALASFSDSVDAVAGRANLQITAAGEGFDERVFAAVRALPGVQAAAPIIQVDALAAPHGGRGSQPSGDGASRRYGESLLLLGVDVFAEPPFLRYSGQGGGESGGTPSRASDGAQSRASDRASDRALDSPSDAGTGFLWDARAVAITRTLAGRHALALGDSLSVLVSGVPTVLRVRQIVDSPEFNQAYGGNVALIDIATAQELFHRIGRLDRIDLIVDDAQRDAITGRIQQLLPPGVEVGPPQGRTRQVENMVRAFRLNLTALSFIALFVSTFLIFNAVSMAVLRRRREVGVLRALGLTRGETLRAFVGEGLALGAAGSALGLVFGTLLARFTLDAVSRTLSDLYLIGHARRLWFDPETYVVGFALGMVVAWLASWVPALEASATAPQLTMRQGMQIEARRVPVGRLTLAGVLTLGLGTLVALWTVQQHQPLGGFVSAFLLLAGFALTAPAVTLAIETLATPVLRRVMGFEGALAARYLREAVARTSAVSAALMVAVGMSVALTIMVGSFRKTVDVWIQQSIRGDIYVEPVGHRQNAGATVLPPEIVAAAGRLPGVAAIDTYRGARIVYHDRLAFAVGLDFEVQREHGQLLFVKGDSRAILGRVLRSGGVVVSESFAHHHRLAAGDTLDLPVAVGIARLPIEGVFFDYSTDAGVIMMDRRTYARLWNDTRTESFALYLTPGASNDAVREALVRLVDGRIVLHVMPNRMLRERVLVVFDQTFQITYALQLIAVLVAVLGVIGALTTLIVQRGREIGVLRASGALRRQVSAMVLAESALLGLIGALLGCACGYALSLLMIHVINKQFFGWTLQVAVDPWVFVQAIALMVVTAVLAGIGPARFAATRVASEAMRVE